jgi:hypothetical protein
MEQAYRNPGRRILRVPYLKNPLLLTIDLSNNLIRELAGFDHLRELRVVDFSGNRLERFDYLCAFSRLTSIHLARNLITALPANLRQLQHLTLLDLAHNRLAGDQLHPLKALPRCATQLQGNPLPAPLLQAYHS